MVSYSNRSPASRRCCGVDHDGIWRGNRLQPRREVRCLADDIALLHLTRADKFADHDQPRGNAETDLMPSTLEQFSRGLDQGQGRPHGVFDVGLVRFGIAEINQHAVAHVLRHIATAARDDVGCALVVGSDHLAQIFRIEPRR